MRLVTVAIVLLAAASTPALAAAQAPLSAPPLEVDVAPFPGPAEPFGRLTQTKVTVDADCLLVFDPYTQRSRRAAISVEGPEWADARFATSEVRFPVPCTPGTRVRAEETLLVRVSALAPSRTPGDVVVSAVVEGGPGGTARAEANATLETAFYASLRSHAEYVERSVREGSVVPVRIVVENVGNGPALASVSVFAVTPGWAVSVPASPERLAAWGADGSSRTLGVEVAAPARVTFGGDAGTVDLLVRLSDAEDESGRYAERLVTLNFQALAPVAHAVTDPVAAVTVGVALAVGVLAAAALVTLRLARLVLPGKRS